MRNIGTKKEIGISAQVLDCAAIVEKETGKTVPAKVLRMCENLYLEMNKATGLGRAYARCGRTPVSESAYVEALQGIGDPDIISEFASALYAGFMRGFNEVKEDVNSNE